VSAQGTAVPVHLISLGCARNEVDSEELAGRLAAGGFQLVDDPDQAEAIMVNTCGFIDAAKKDSVDTLLAAADLKGAQVKAVVAVGCLAERYGAELAEALPEADAILGFDDYPDIAARLTAIIAGERPRSHDRRDRRTLLPLTPVDRPDGALGISVPGHAELPAGLAPSSGPRVLRKRLASGPSAPLKIASGCDRRCAFCAIPSFRGSYLSRPVAEVVGEARWLVESGVREVVLVSENSTGYGRDLGTNLETLVAELSGVDGLDWIRVSYLQPAEIHSSLLHSMLTLPNVVPYFDLPFQHASEPLLRRMRRFGNPESFLDLLARIRAERPEAGIRSNVILGFPGETEEMVEELADFLAAAEMDAVGVFGYSDEEGTEGERLRPKVAEEVIAERVDRIATLVETVSADRAAARIGSRVQVLIEGVDEAGDLVGRSAHQGPETDGQTIVRAPGESVAVGGLVWSIVSEADGVDLLAELEKR
jgi:ribosomal protein S12 methylthiotransferase